MPSKSILEQKQAVVAELAEKLMLQGGKTIELHYKEYFGRLPWRGFTKFIVDSIITVEHPHAVPMTPLQPAEPVEAIPQQTL